MDSWGTEYLEGIVFETIYLGMAIIFDLHCASIAREPGRLVPGGLPES